MLPCFVTRQAKNSVPIKVVHQAEYSAWLARQASTIKQWLTATQFKGEAGNVSIVPDAAGKIQCVICCVADTKNSWCVGSLPSTLPEGVYRFDPNNFAQVGDTQTILPTVSSFTSIPNNNASLIYEFPSSAKVTSLVMDKSTGNVGKTLAVGVMNNGEGEVYFFNINTLGWFTNNTFDSSFKGLGEVIHLSKKF